MAKYGKIAATQSGNLWLIDVGDGTGRVYDMDANMITVPMELGRITNSGYWEPYPKDESQEVIDDLLETAIETDEGWNPISN